MEDSSFRVHQLYRISIGENFGAPNSIVLTSLIRKNYRSNQIEFESDGGLLALLVIHDRRQFLY